MESYFEKQVDMLYEQANTLIQMVSMMKMNRAGEKAEVDVPLELKQAFLNLIDKVSSSLMEEQDCFYGYFLFQMEREIRFDISTPTAVNFKGARYVIYFNPLIFLSLNRNQMKDSIKHEIMHIVSLHLLRAKGLKSTYSKIALNIAMDMVVNQYLKYLPPYATTLEWVNLKYELKLRPYEPFEYYVEKVQIALDLLEEDEEGDLIDQPQQESIQTEYDVARTHDLWEECDSLDEQTIHIFTKRFVEQADKGPLPIHLGNMIAALKKEKGELSWDLYLKRLMGTIESHTKKTTTRRNRRQPDRLDLRGTLRGHKAEIAIALDISGSISDEQFKQAMKEVLHIVKNYNHAITIIECDDEIRRTYQVKSIKDIEERPSTRGATKFTPVFEYANKKHIDLLIYFTDGKGEQKLQIRPRGYKILWILSEKAATLSLQESYGAIKRLNKVETKDEFIEMRDVRSDGYSMNNQAPIW